MYEFIIRYVVLFIFSFYFLILKILYSYVVWELYGQDTIAMLYPICVERAYTQKVRTLLLYFKIIEL